jgi:hypothetical protein
MTEECPTCGRVSPDWSAAASKGGNGLKGRQHHSREDRTAPYRDWRWRLGGGLYVNDIDQVEWRLRGGQITPVAVLELTRVNGTMPVPARYLDNILQRICHRDPQGRVAVEIADRLVVCAYLVLWRWDLSEFWCYNLTDGKGWQHWNRQQYQAWLKAL